MPDMRPRLLDRLQVDLIGSETVDEQISDRPIDRYLTGILYPQKSEITAADQDPIGDNAGVGPGDDEDVDQPPELSSLRKPAAMGLSFRLRRVATEVTATEVPLVVRIFGGQYESSTERSAGPMTAGAGRVPRKWKRIERRCEIPIALKSQKAAFDKKEGFGELHGFYLHVVTERAGDELVATVTLINGNEFVPGSQEESQDRLALFQAQMRIERPTGWRFEARPIAEGSSDPDARLARLIYRNAREFAVGHTCAAEWSIDATGDATEIRTTWLPIADVALVSGDGHDVLRKTVRLAALDGLKAITLADPACDLARVLGAIPDGYGAWIDDRLKQSADLPGELGDQARENLVACRESEQRMRAGIRALLADPKATASFRLMNRSMALQREWSEPEDGPLVWRPFQLGFFLQVAESVCNPECKDRAIMDLLWFPTGGGKTEAYLGLIAFVLFLRRMRADKDTTGGGVACLMRYTLRLLTLQQFERAAALILACEFIRRGGIRIPGCPDLTKSAPMSLGLWVGGSATPNKMDEACDALASANPPVTPKQLTACPCCKQPLSWRATESRDDLRVSCSNDSCVLRAIVPFFPLLTVDELIYRNPPSLVIGTIDKFAQLVRNGDSQSLFRTPGSLPPELIIQDELHLISGALGSLAGLYETAIDMVCERNGVRAKIIGSTATVRRAADQVLQLFGRAVAQFPPQGIDADDSCFAVVPDGATTRRFVGVTTAGRSAKFVMQAVYASLLQSANALPESERDGYYTLVGYFNALRELGGALPLVRQDTVESMELLASRRGEAQRILNEIVELTSRVSQAEIRERLTQIADDWWKAGAADVVLATNMISVGVDVKRLGLMVVMGQPKTRAEYIQATSRVGRDALKPGLVCAILNNLKPRDRSHFETFVGWHGALYRGVEATSVTPFAARARDRALHATLVLAARNLVPALSRVPALTDDSLKELRMIAARIVTRIEEVDPSEADDARVELDQIIAHWVNRTAAIEQYWTDDKPRLSLLISAERAAATTLTSRGPTHAWPTLNSMRNVEPGTQVKLCEVMPHAS